MSVQGVSLVATSHPRRQGGTGDWLCVAGYDWCFQVVKEAAKGAAKEDTSAKVGTRKRKY